MSFAYEFAVIESYQQRVNELLDIIARKDHIIRHLNEQLDYISDGETYAAGWNYAGQILIKRMIAENAACPHKHTYCDAEQIKIEHKQLAESEYAQLKEKERLKAEARLKKEARPK